MCRNRSRLFFRNKYTTTRLRSPANMFLLRIFVLRYNSTLSGFFHGAFNRLLLFTKKYFSHQSFRTCRLRYEINTTKKLNKSLLVQRKKCICYGSSNDSGLFHSQNIVQNKTNRYFSSAQEKYPSRFGKRFNLCRSQNDVQNKKESSQQTIPNHIER